MCMHILPACMYVNCMRGIPLEAKEIIGSHRVRNGCEPTDKGAGNDSRSYKSANVLNY